MFVCVFRNRATELETQLEAFSVQYLQGNWRDPDCWRAAPPAGRLPEPPVCSGHSCLNWNPVSASEQTLFTLQLFSRGDHRSTDDQSTINQWSVHYLSICSHISCRCFQQLWHFPELSAISLSHDTCLNFHHLWMIMDYWSLADRTFLTSSL